MRHGEIALGVAYAAALRDRVPLGHSDIRKVVIIDAEKKYAWGESRTVVENWRSGMGGMHAQVTIPDQDEPVDWVVFPVDLVGTWTDHEAEQKRLARKQREAKAAERRNERAKKALRKRLNASGFDVVSNYGGDRWYVPTEILVPLLDAYEKAQA